MTHSSTRTYCRSGPWRRWPPPLRVQHPAARGPGPPPLRGRRDAPALGGDAAQPQPFWRPAGTLAPGPGGGTVSTDFPSGGSPHHGDRPGGPLLCQPLYGGRWGREATVYRTGLEFTRLTENMAQQISGFIDRLRAADLTSWCPSTDSPAKEIAEHAPVTLFGGVNDLKSSSFLR